jgi:hypothetical protein
MTRNQDSTWLPGISPLGISPLGTPPLDITKHKASMYRFHGSKETTFQGISQGFMRDLRAIQGDCWVVAARRLAQTVFVLPLP